MKRGSEFGSGLVEYRKWAYSEYQHSKTKHSSCPLPVVLTYTHTITAESKTSESSHVLITLLDKHKAQWLRQNTTGLTREFESLLQREKHRCN